MEGYEVEKIRFSQSFIEERPFDIYDKRHLIHHVDVIFAKGKQSIIKDVITSINHTQGTSIPSDLFSYIGDWLISKVPYLGKYIHPNYRSIPIETITHVEQHIINVVPLDPSQYYGGKTFHIRHAPPVHLTVKDWLDACPPSPELLADMKEEILEDYKCAEIMAGTDLGIYH